MSNTSHDLDDDQAHDEDHAHDHDEDHAHDHDEDHAHDHDAEPVTDRIHENSWSANLEKPEHGRDEALVRHQAVEAVEHTAAGYHVNLVTHGDHGHPGEYLFATLEETFGDDYDWEYIEQCGCGGHVTRVHVS